MSLPAGTVTFLFTDIEGSTRLFERLGDDYQGLLERHYTLVRGALATHGGAEVKTLGDGFFVAFEGPGPGVGAALAVQLAHVRERWPDGAEVRVRMGLHTGEATPIGGDYAAFAVHQGARVAAAAHGGQVLVSEATRTLLDGGVPDGATFADLGEHRLKDLTAPQRLFQLCHAELPAEFPPLRTLDRVPHNLPVQLTSFVGRDEDVAEVRALLDGARMVTLTGAGGCGKTRLGLQVAADASERHPGGMWFVDLGSISDPGLVVGEVAAALRVREEPGRDLLDLVAQRIADQEVLLVLDNCEHLLDRCADVTEALVRACPSLRVLATSREALRVPGETAWRVPSLPVPGPAGHNDPERASESPAVRLFVERAHAVAPDFIFAGEEAASVADICRRLDGIPLAIELAAARVDALSATQIDRRLDDRFRLLTGGGRSTMERQRTLRAAVDWSHDLLEGAERTLLRRLSVFAGGLTLEAAEEVCGSDPIPREEVIDLLAGLVRKSLVLAERRDGDVRYRMLETVRQYAAEKLAESGEGPSLRDHHRDWFLALAEEFDAGGSVRLEPAWMSRLEEEHDNLVAALEWSLAGDDPEPALRFVGALNWFWDTHAHYEEARRFAEDALERSAGAAAEHRARALYVAGRFAWRLRDYVVARRAAEESRELSRAHGYESGEAFALSLLANLLQESGEWEGVRPLHEEALALFRQIGDDAGVAMMLGNMGAFANRRGDVDAAVPLAEEAVEIFARVGNRRGEAMYAGNLAAALTSRGEHERATAARERALEAARELGDPLMISMNIGERAARLWATGDMAGARNDLEEVGRLFAQMGEARGVGWAEAMLAAVAEESGDRERALAHAARALELARQDSQPDVELLRRAQIAKIEGRLEDWRALTNKALELERAESVHLQREAWLGTMIEAAYAAAWSGDRQRALALATEVVELAGNGMRGPRIHALNVLGRLEGTGGEGPAASAFHRDALRAAVLDERVGEIAVALDGFAAVAGEADRGGRLFGAATALRTAIGIVVPPYLQEWRQRALDRSREAAPDAFDGAFAAAAVMRRKDVLTLAAELVEGGD